MDPARWRLVKKTFSDALDLSPAQREAFLRDACRDDHPLRLRVEKMLASHEEASGFLESGPAELLRALPYPAPMPSRIGSYRLVGELGTGGMGTVYRGVRDDDQFDQAVAIKLLQSASSEGESARRFLIERQILANLEHPFIGRLLDGGQTEAGRLYLIMELVDGKPISTFCDQAELPIRARVELFRKVCSAVQYAHQNLIVHRDLKPSNILVKEDSTPKLLDFGIAKLMGRSLQEMTRTELRPMTLSYASPEQVLGEAISTSTDVYALGVLLFEILVGASPYRAAVEGGPPAQLARAIAEGEVPRPSDVMSGALDEDESARIAKARGTDPRRLRRRLLGDLDTIVLKALQKDPRRRYASVEQLSEDLRRHLEDLPVLARPDSPTYHLMKFVGRNRLASAGMASICLSALAMGWFGYRAGVDRNVAEQQRLRAETMAGFTMDLFRESDPDVAQGGELTARDLLQQGALRVRRDFAEQPDLQATMAEFIGNVYARLGLYQEARPLLEEALELRRGNPATEPLTLADSNDLLSDLLRDLGELDRAEKLQREALNLRQGSLAPDHPVLADTHNDLGVILRRRGELDRAEEHLRLAQELYQAQYGPNHPRLGTVLNNLASLLKDRGEIAEAATMMEEGLRIHRLELGDEHPNVILGLQNLGSLYLDLGDLNKAVELLREAETKMMSLVGEAHIHTFIVRQSLAYGYSLRGESQRAQELLTKVVETSQQVLGPDHPISLGARARLAAVLAERGELGAAAGALEELAKNKPDLAERFPILSAEVLVTRGEVALAQGNETLATPLLMRGCTILEEHVPAGHPKHRRCKLNLAEAVWASGDLAGARRRYEEALALQRSVLQAGHPELAKPLLALAEIALELGDRGEAASRLEEATPPLTSLHPSSWLLAVAASLGGALEGFEQGASMSSTSKLREAHQTLVDQRGGEAPATQRAQRRLETLGGTA